MIPHVQDLHDEYKSKGLVVMAPHVQSADRETLEVFTLKHGITYPVAIKSDTSQYPGRGIPRGALIDVNGKIVWQGHPGSSEFKKLLEKELKKVDKFGEISLIRGRTHKAIGKKIYSGKLGAAWKALTKANPKSEGAGTTEATSDLDMVMARLKAQADGMLGQAKKMIEAGDLWGAEKMCIQVEKTFKGCEFADQAKALKKEIKAMDGYKGISKAGKVWDQVKVLASSKTKKAIMMAEMLVARFGDTYYGKEADKVARLLKSSK